MMRSLLRGTSLVLSTVLGWSLVGLGLVLLVTPGPGLLLMAAGTAVLARHHHWAARLRDRVRARIATVRRGAGAPGRLSPGDAGTLGLERDAA